MRKALLLLALGWGAFVVLVPVAYYVEDGEWLTAAGVLIGGAFLLVPVGLPLLLLRSRWYRIGAFGCGLVAAFLFVALALLYAFYLMPSALLVLLSVLPPQPR